MNAVRPRARIAPIPFAIGISLDKSFASKWVLRMLSRLGISIGDMEVTRFKESLVFIKQTQPEEERDGLNNSFVQWVGDNVDHNLATLTGKGTFHGMGIISVRNGTNKSDNKPILRLQDKPKTSSLVAASSVPLQSYNRPIKAL